jgi:hypothetical protein
VTLLGAAAVSCFCSLLLLRPPLPSPPRPDGAAEPSRTLADDAAVVDLTAGCEADKDLAADRETVTALATIEAPTGSSSKLSTSDTVALLLSDSLLCSCRLVLMLRL